MLNFDLYQINDLFQEDTDRVEKINKKADENLAKLDVSILN